VASQFSGFPFSSADFSPFFRIFDEVTDLDSLKSKDIMTFQPRFDVREEKDAFHVQGELPGVPQENIQIEFTDHNRLLIKGRVVSEHSEGDHDNETPQQGKILSEEDSKKAKQPTVEEETSAEGSSTTNSTNHEQQQVTKKDEGQQQVSRPTERKWLVRERSVGEFRRSFTFPGRVDQDGVKASLKNGILEIVVPKAATSHRRVINLE
jgi:HSP20 family molecular chaperone IbpA